MKITPAWDFSTLAVGQIEAEDTPFNWFPGVLSANAQNSLTQDGVQLPLLVQAVQDSRYLLVDGFKRFFWLTSATEFSDKKELTTQFPCLVIPESVMLSDVAKIRLQTLPTVESNFSGVQLSGVLKLFLENGYSKDEIAVQVLPRFGQKSSVRLVRQLLDLVEKLAELEQHQQFPLPDSIMRLGCEDILPLLKFSQKEISSVVALVERMEVSGKKWRNLLQVLDEVSRLRETSASEILALPEIQKILMDSNLQGPVRYRLLKQLLDSWRYPELSDLRQKFKQGRKRLKLAPRMTLESDQFFENDDLTLTLKIRSFEELRKHLKYLGSGATELTTENTEELWNDLFAVLQED
jgi:hypothetical protein